MNPPLPLAGIRVLDFSRLLPGPWASQMLGEFGADVIKVEQPVSGDPSRHNQPKAAPWRTGWCGTPMWSSNPRGPAMRHGSAWITPR